MTDKLTIGHLAPYLPYQLHCQFSTGTIFEMGLYNNMRGTGIETRTIDQCLDMKPVLRPLSQLTKEITHNGKTFVPLVELFNLRYTAGAYEILCLNEGDNIYDIEVTWDKAMTSSTLFYYNAKDMCFGTLNHSTHDRLPYQLQMFQKMFEWHFDVFGLLEQNLALPKQ